MYLWPIDQILARADRRPKKVPVKDVQMSLLTAGYSTTLAAFVAPLYTAANGVTFFEGAIRILPLEGFDHQGVPGLVPWNDRKGWKRHAPPKARNVFWFMSNAFGDLFGVPISPWGELLRDRLAVLWVAKHLYEESGRAWSLVMDRMDEDDVASSICRLKDYMEASARFGKPKAWQCLSVSDDGFELRSLAVHVSSTLQQKLVRREKSDLRR